jgi:hypothetical protein
MTSHITASGFELPIFGNDEPFYRKSDLVHGKPIAPTPSFIREIKFIGRPSAPVDVGELLRRTDEELETVALACGALVVEHDWGVIASTETVSPEYAASNVTGMPNGHNLAARVQTIEEDLAHDRLSAIRVLVGMCGYRKRKQDALRLGDVDYQQFIYGRRLADSLEGKTTPPAYWYVDIEPTLINI